MLALRKWIIEWTRIISILKKVAAFLPDRNKGTLQVLHAIYWTHGIFLQWIWQWKSFTSKHRYGAREWCAKSTGILLAYCKTQTRTNWILFCMIDVILLIFDFGTLWNSIWGSQVKIHDLYLKRWPPHVHQSSYFFYIHECFTAI